LGTIKHGIPQWSILGPFLIIIYINDRLPILNTSSIPIIFADDAGVIIFIKNLDDFCMLSNKDLSQMSQWFSANKLSLYLDKTNVIKFITKNSPQYRLNIGCNDNYIDEAVNGKFLGLEIDNHLNWKNHINQLVPKLSGACYVVRSVLHISNTDILKTIYFTYFHSLM
jgi:hypothetical protein